MPGVFGTIGAMPKLLEQLKSFYKTQGRSHLPWRKSRDPYKILVSEVMLQQTQVERVVPKYEIFIETFPEIEALAKAPLSKVLLLWSGLGYNRRAKHLYETAKVLAERGGEFPKDPAEIEKLPGIGRYTARAVAAFAWNKPEVFVETNIRTVFIYHCFKNRRKLDVLIADAEILPLVEKALRASRMEPRDFYAALMDYGSYLKRKGIRLNARTKHYAKQSKFEGSYRQLRGAVLRNVLERPCTIEELTDKTARKKNDVLRVVANLSEEGMIIIKNRKIFAPK